MLASLQHPHIVPYLDHFWHEAEQALYVVMAHCDCGDLLGLIERTQAKATDARAVRGGALYPPPLHTRTRTRRSHHAEGRTRHSPPLQTHVGFRLPAAPVERRCSRASPPHRRREDGLARPADTSRTNLAAALGPLSRALHSTHTRAVHSVGGGGVALDGAADAGTALPALCLSHCVSLCLTPRTRGRFTVSEAAVWRWTVQLMLALHYLHCVSLTVSPALQARAAPRPQEPGPPPSPPSTVPRTAAAGEALGRLGFGKPPARKQTQGSSKIGS